MKSKLLKVVIILLAATFVSGVMGMSKEKTYRPYEVTADEIDTTNIVKKVVCDRSFEQPKDENLEKRLLEVLCTAETEASRVRHMYEKGMVRVKCWNNRHTGTVISKSKKAVYCFDLTPVEMKLRSAEKRVFFDKPFGERDRSSGFSVSFFHEGSDSVKRFEYMQNDEDELLEFHKTGRLKFYKAIILDEYHRAQWDEDGKLLLETRRKINK